MDFKTATDRLGIAAPELARELSSALGTSVSAQWIRQARLDPKSRGYRDPPAGWHAVVARLARERGEELATLVKELEEAGVFFQSSDT